MKYMFIKQNFWFGLGEGGGGGGGGSHITGNNIKLPLDI